MQRLTFVWLLLFLFVHSEFAQEAKRKVKSKKIKENLNLEDEVDDESGIFSTYADNRYAPSDSLTVTTTTATTTRTRWTTPASAVILQDTDDHLEQARFMATSPSTCYSVVDMNHPLLADACGALPQGRYTLPNLFGHRERWQVELFLHGLISATADTGCLRSLRLLLCPLLLPPCPSQIDTPALLPCQAFCQAAKTQCSISVLDFLPCQVLPVSSDLCPTSQVYGPFFSQGSTGMPLHLVRSKITRPLQMPIQDDSSWNNHIAGQYGHDQPTTHQMDYSPFFMERSPSFSSTLDNYRTSNRLFWE